MSKAPACAVKRFLPMAPYCASSRPKKNHVGFRISQVRLDTPTSHTAKQTNHSLRGREGRAIIDSTKTPSKAQKTARPITPCSTRTDKNVLWAGGAGESGSSRRIGSAKTRQTTSRNAFDPIPRNGCSRKISQPALQITLRPESVPCSNASGTVESRSQEVAGTKTRTDRKSVV